jgi:DNA-binding NtrC family response regulator
MKSILIVEDNSGLRRVLRDHIRRTTNHTCQEAASYTTARALLHDRFFHLVICDISLDNQNGMELLALIKTSWPDTEVIMMSAICDRVTTSGALRLGASAFLAKPFELGDASAAIEIALSKRRAAA